MIEFKARCGHTVRAKDNDAGGIVRCTYCGAPADVPVDGSHEVSFLLHDIDDAKAKANAAEPKGRRWFQRGPGSRRSFAPFAVVFRLCYLAGLIIVVVILVRKVIIPLTDPKERERRFASLGLAPREVRETASRPSTVRRGLVDGADAGGIYIQSVPSGAAAFCVSTADAPVAGRISAVPQAIQLEASGQAVRVANGSYVVEVAFPWNHPSLSHPDLSQHAEYLAFRRAVEHASEEERRKLINEFFLPDAADEVFVDRTPDQIYFVRQYRNVVVDHERSSGVRALFLPRIAPTRGAFVLTPLLNGYLPANRAYEFDEKHVRSELHYYGVSGPEEAAAIEALWRIGTIPLVTPDKRVLLFKIGICDGTLSAAVLRELPP